MGASLLLPDVLRARALREPARTAYVLLDEYGEQTATLTYADLHARALAVAGLLARHCEPGARALLLFPQGLDFIVAYFGCLYARVIAVPVSPPRRDHVQDATMRIVRDCEPAVVLTDGAMRRAAGATLGPHCGPAVWLRVDEVTGDQAAAVDVEPAACSPQDVAFLQYTSGSTADPKGVMVTHGNLVANERMIEHAFGHDRDTTVVGWAPLFHDQGLIGNVLQPLTVGARCVLMSPTAFIRRPLLWLTAISRYRAHTSGGPNFAYDACVAKAARSGPQALEGLDLSCWKVAFDGAEPIRPATLRAFAAAFAPVGFDERALYPCYGLAEATLYVTGSGKGRGPRLLDADTEALRAGRLLPAAPGPGASLLAGSGVVPPQVTVRIVDPGSGRERPSGQVGEIWVAGPNVAAGYWRRPEASAATFQARCLDDPEHAYLRTGDLGVLVDGELVVVGRLKDMVIIRGRNHFPQDIERTAQSAHPALREGGCAAFSVTQAGLERLVVVQEIRGDHRRSADAAQVAASVRAAVTREHQVSVGDLLLTVPGALDKTTSGKIMRAAARARYLAAGFEVWSGGPDR